MTTYLRVALRLAVLAVAVFLMALTACRPKAFAQDDGGRTWVRQSLRSSCEWWETCRYRYYRKPRQVYLYAQKPDDRGQCLGTSVDVLSTEHTDETNAREAARKLWMAKTQWGHGGVYMNLDEAVDVRWRCGPSNAHDTFSARIVENAQKLVGRDGQNMRCSLSARPCKAEMERGRGR